MKEIIGFSIVGIALLLGLTWLVQGNSFFLYKVFAPKTEQVRREVFEESKAYRQGMAQEIEAMRFEYEKGTPEQQAALRSLILHRVADVDPSVFRADTQAWLRDLSAGR